MGTPSSGVIALSDLKNEWSDTNPVSLSEFYAGGTYVGADAVGVPTSGAASLSQYYNLYNVWVSGVTGLSTFATIVEPVIDSSNNIYFCVSGTSGSVVLMKINSAGVLQWQYQYAASVNVNISRIQRDSSNNIYIAGTSGSGLNVAGRADAILIKIDSNGTFQWATSFRLNSFTGSPQRTTSILDIGVDSSNNIYCVGNYVTPDVNNRNVLQLTKINSSGTVQWYKAFEIYIGSAFYGLNSPVIAVDSSGNSYVGTSSQQGAAFIRYNSSGSLTGYVNYNSNPATHMIVDGNGYINCSSNVLPGIFQIDSSFNYRWSQQQTSGFGSFTSVFLDSSNNIYGTSDSAGPNFIKFNNSGTLQWQRYNKVNIGFSEGNYGVYGGAVDSSGNLYTGMFAQNLSPSYAFIKKYPNNVYLPVSSVNVFTLSGPLTYKYQTSSFTFGAASFPTNNTSGISYNDITPGIFDPYSNSITTTSPGFTPLKINSAY